MENISSSKLFTTRQGTILLGVIAAVIAAIALLVFLNQYRSGATSTVQVLVAKKTIPQGTSGDVLAKSTGFYTVAQIPKGKVLSGAITDSSTLSGKVALADINPNSQLTEAQFGAGTGVVQTAQPERAGGRRLSRLAAVGGRADRRGQPRRLLGDDERPGRGRCDAADREAAVPEHARPRRERRERHAEGVRRGRRGRSSTPPRTPRSGWRSATRSAGTWRGRRSSAA